MSDEGGLQVQRFDTTDDREAQDVEASFGHEVLQAIGWLTNNGPTDPDSIAQGLAPLLATRERAAAEKARADERERIALAIERAPLPYTLSDIGQQGWHLGRIDAARIARGGKSNG